MARPAPNPQSPAHRDHPSPHPSTHRVGLRLGTRPRQVLGI